MKSEAARTGILLVNLGTPEAPTAPAVRRYFKEFLSDPRVVEIPRAVWAIVLRLVILPLRPSRSAAKYASVWTAEGSPLMVWTVKQTRLLRGLLGARGFDLGIEFAMRYGDPSIASVLSRLKDGGHDRILVLPMYPQYSATTTGSTIDAVLAWASTQRDVPELRFVKQYHDDTGYVDALAARIEAFREREGVVPGERLVMSFHGIPQRSTRLGDPYHGQCLATAAALAARLGLADDAWRATFQSRFGRAAWLEPYTVEVLRELGRAKVPVAICCPGFPADCLETLEEIAMEGRQAYLEAGGVAYRYIPCLDDEPAWIAALAAIAARHLQGWPID